MAKAESTDKRAPKASTKKPRRPGKGGIYPPANGKKFTKDYQPSGEAKSAGKLAKKRGQELAKSILDLAFKGMQDSQLKKSAAEYFGIDPSEITVEMMLLFRQAEKAIQKADTNAFNAYMNRAFGMPKQQTELSGEAILSPFSDKQVTDIIKVLRENKRT
jgi:hypothetical protein